LVIAHLLLVLKLIGAFLQSYLASSELFGT
jgi:hypothetical protein